jgi:hypothetical protein
MDTPTEKPTVGFQERYNSDAEFKRQVDDARRRSAQKRSLDALKAALDMQRTGKKHY